MSIRLVWALLLAGGISAVHADTLSDLKSTLAGLPAQEPFKAQLTYQRTSYQGARPKSEPAANPVSAVVHSSPEGLQIFWTREMLERAAARSDEQGNADRQAMNALNVSMVSDYLDGTRRLRTALETAVLLEEKPSTWRDQPARSLRLKFDPPLGERKKYIKEVEATATLWLDEAGMPLAAETRVYVKGRAMLVVGFESTNSERFEFARIGDRLVIRSHTIENQGSGGGESNGSASAITLTPLPG